MLYIVLYMCYAILNQANVIKNDESKSAFGLTKCVFPLFDALLFIIELPIGISMGSL